MTPDPASLENLRDIAEPPPVSWWPLAPGWWFVIAFLAFGCIVILYRLWCRWQANAYRRAAIAEVQRASSDAEIVGVLKRTALCADNRTHVGSLSGKNWCDWLSATGRAPVPNEVADRISVGVYRDGSARTPALVEFATRWIRQHQVSRQGDASIVKTRER